MSTHTHERIYACMTIREWGGGAEGARSAGSGVTEVGDGWRERSLSEGGWGRGRWGMWKGMEDVQRAVTALSHRRLHLFFETR